MPEASTLAKPQLRGLLKSSFRKHAIVAAVLCTLSVSWWKHYVVDARKQRYAEFYKTYDAEKDYARMVKAGVLTDIPAMARVNK